MQTMNAHGLPNPDELQKSDSDGPGVQPAACEELGVAPGAFAGARCFSWCPLPGCYALCGAVPPAAPGEDGTAPQQPFSAPAHGTRD